jgi:hypothetical protein
MLCPRRIAVHTRQAKLRPFSGFPSASFMKVVNERSCLKMIQRIPCCACSFWNPTDSVPQHFGTCQRYAPRPGVEGQDFEWAATLAGDWCGEAQPARIPHERQVNDDDRDDARQALEYVKSHPALFVSEGAQLVLINMLKDRFGL